VCSSATPTTLPFLSHDKKRVETFQADGAGYR
jgi:hypothetical protein